MTPENCFTHLLKNPEFKRRIPRIIKQLLLKLLTIIASEAVCGTHGSIMETYHTRFTNTDIDHSQPQKEIFIRYVGPGIINSNEIIKKTVSVMNKNFILSERAKFSNIFKVLKKQLDEIYDFSVLKF